MDRPERAERLVVFVNARVGANPQHGEANAPRAVDLILRRTHAFAAREEIRRGRGAGARGIFGVRMQLRCVIALLGHDDEGGGLHGPATACGTWGCAGTCVSCQKDPRFWGRCFRPLKVF